MYVYSIPIRRHEWMKWGKCLCCLVSTGRFHNWGPSALSSSPKNPPMESRYLVLGETWKLMRLKNPPRRGSDGEVEGAWDSGAKAAVKHVQNQHSPPVHFLSVEVSGKGQQKHSHPVERKFRILASHRVQPIVKCNPPPTHTHRHTRTTNKQTEFRLSCILHWDTN